MALVKLLDYFPTNKLPCQVIQLNLTLLNGISLDFKHISIVRELTPEGMRIETIMVKGHYLQRLITENL